MLLRNFILYSSCGYMLAFTTISCYTTGYCSGFMSLSFKSLRSGLYTGV